MKPATNPPHAPRAGSAPFNTRLAEQLAGTIATMRFGTVELTVHDGRVVQLEKREKFRLDLGGDTSPSPTA